MIISSLWPRAFKYFYWNVIWARDKIKFSNLTICRLPALLHGHHAPWRHHSPQRRPLQARQAPRPARLQGAADRPQGLWRPALPWLHPPVPGVGARRQDDAQRRPEARLAQAEVTQAPAGGINICEDMVYVYNALNWIDVVGGWDANGISTAHYTVNQKPFARWAYPRSCHNHVSIFRRWLRAPRGRCRPLTPPAPGTPRSWTPSRGRARPRWGPLWARTGPAPSTAATTRPSSRRSRTLWHNSSDVTHDWMWLKLED